MFNQKSTQAILKKVDEQSRRHIIKGLAAGLLTLNYSEGVEAAVTRPKRRGGKEIGGKAKSVIFIMVSGGLSQVDSFDIKEAQ